MSDGLNWVMLIGNLGADPELRHSPNGHSVMKLRLATTGNYVDKDSVKQEVTDWHRVAMFGRRGETLSKALKKGERVLVQGRLHTSSYEKQGQKHYSTEVIASDIFVRSDERTNGGYGRPPVAETSVAAADLPF
jgi:single-strand DNA-binding protein